VFPAAIERDILIACAPRDLHPRPEPSNPLEVHHAPGNVVVENLHPKYGRQHFAPSAIPKDLGVSDDEVHVESWHLDIDTKQLRWESYVKAGYYVIAITGLYAPSLTSLSFDFFV
jgi:hypothetical protein